MKPHTVGVKRLVIRSVIGWCVGNDWRMCHESLAARNANRFSWDQACCKAKIHVVDHRIRILAEGIGQFRYFEESGNRVLSM